MDKIYNIFEIIDNYDVVLFDIWGVILEHLPYPEAVKAINKIKQIKDTYIVTNMANSRMSVKQKLFDAGLDIAADKIFTAGETGKRLIEDSKISARNQKIFCFSDNVCNDLFSRQDFYRTENIEEAGLIILSQYVDNMSDTTKFDNALAKAAAICIPALCTNPDVIVPYDSHERYCAGYFAERYINMGGKVHFSGKPYKEIYEAVFKQIKNLDKSRVLMVGDTLETDIQGAKNVGIDSALVTTGNMNKFLIENNIPYIKSYDAIISNAIKATLPPNWVIEIK